ncbi:hypothetical protein VMCG_09151 [Cytospora schulzeri]|uniref:AHC1-like C2H2 zinc-finger domain-containing protein n=1 Tax=Cytospora schulzeri TaxID=448051 RepID=A0A423VN15_9PEZI|nr:hypothetical protein VMCG_09151 [Valsa malicola]
MFRFWSSDAKGGDKLVEEDQTMAMLSRDLPSLATSPRSLKRKASIVQDGSEDDVFGAKRAKLDYSVATPPETPAMPHQEYFASQSPQPAPNTDRIVNIINEQFGTEILLKHQELRFINQELAKCQVALEQLRRCHLIPYPTSCPTPQQMLDIAQGKGPAVQSKHGEAAPQWAPPFGVVDGPYARHYAKWLIPDPKFDGMLPEWQGIPNIPRNAAEGRTTRNSLTDASAIGKRVGRGQTGQKLSVSYPPPKPKAPCIVKKSDGITVKLVCNFCHREDFSSTQGFINHCRIAHKKEYKSHEEAAVDCGRPISVTESGSVGGEEKPSSTPPASGIVHPLARPDATADQNAYATLLGRIDDSLRLLHQGNLPGTCRIPAVAPPSHPAEVVRKPSKSFAGASATPFLSKLLQKRDFKGDLSEHVQDATTKMDLDGILSGEDDYDEGEQPVGSNTNEAIQNKIPTAGARVPTTAMRMPARAVPAPQAPGPRPSSSKGRSPHLSFTSTSSNLPDAGSPTNGEYESLGVDDANLMEVEQSPTTATSINAPSLVSDDGGDDESDDGSSSDASDDASMADVAEVNIEYPEVQDLSQHGSGASTGARMKKDENRHVTFVTPMTGKAAARRKPNV